MTTNVAGSTSSYPANVRVIADGDRANAANLGAAARDLADRTNTLKAQTLPLVTRTSFIPTMWKKDASVDSSYLPTSARTGIELFDGRDSAGTGRHNFNFGGTEFTEVVTGSNEGYAHFMLLGRHTLAQGRTLSSASLRIASIALSLPQQVPAMLISRIAGGTVEHLTAAMVEDSSANYAAYTVQGHFLTYTPTQNNVIDHDSYIYALTFLPEGGADAATPFFVFELLCTHT